VPNPRAAIDDQPLNQRSVNNRIHLSPLSVLTSALLLSHLPVIPSAARTASPSTQKQISRRYAPRNDRTDGVTFEAAQGTICCFLLKTNKSRSLALLGMTSSGIFFSRLSETAPQPYPESGGYILNTPIN
jgi:hypothetical protein